MIWKLICSDNSLENREILFEKRLLKSDVIDQYTKIIGIILEKKNKSIVGHTIKNFVFVFVPIPTKVVDSRKEAF